MLTSSGRSRRLTWLLVALSVADVLLTWWLLRNGEIYEANPLARHILETAGWLGMVGFKGLMVAGALLLLAVVSRHRPEAARRGLVLSCTLVGLVVCYSISLATVVEPRRQQDEEQMRQLETERQRRMDEELARVSAFRQELNRRANEIVAGLKSLSEAVAELELVDDANDPYWVHKLRQMNPGLSRRQVVEQKLLSIAEDMR